MADAEKCDRLGYMKSFRDKVLAQIDEGWDQFFEEDEDPLEQPVPKFCAQVNEQVAAELEAIDLGWDDVEPVISEPPPASTGDLWKDIAGLGSAPPPARIKRPRTPLPPRRPRRLTSARPPVNKVSVVPVEISGWDESRGGTLPGMPAQASISQEMELAYIDAGWEAIAAASEAPVESDEYNVTDSMIEVLKECPSSEQIVLSDSDFEALSSSMPPMPHQATRLNQCHRPKLTKDPPKGCSNILIPETLLPHHLNNL